MNDCRVVASDYRNRQLNLEQKPVPSSTFSFNLFSVVVVAGKALFSPIEKVVYMIFNREREKTHNKCLFFDSFHDILGKLR